ncbi:MULTISPECIES: retropepsin-like aspartic protease [unclassified Pseudoalteromonas]|uniref:retropepsin-like aspartic protease n=1 Tax=unclassified Pseudoalteromonas TaxID=194690 RepID=UPI00209712B6|nr:retropepsin-like aspartic protease [Pseudoalteromonas sp. XMcav2-N]MCO7190175.1 retropepsin-like domain-containing protein [Pseudoalteromonas sp. XMcav2-N]
MMKLVLLSLSALLSFTAGAGATAWLSLNIENGHAKVPAKVAGIEGMAILDTGAHINAINQRFINHNNLEFAHRGHVDIEGMHGQQRQKLYANIETEVFGIQSSMNGLAAATLGHHTNALLLGAGFFSQSVVQLDYPNQRVRMLTRDAVNVGKHENIKTYAHLGTGMPIVEVEIAGKPIWLLLDTGYTGGILISRRLAEGLDLVTPDAKHVTSAGVNEFAVMRETQLAEMRLGPFTLANVAIAYPDEGHRIKTLTQYQHTSSKIRGRKVRGVIGYDALKHFLLTLDYAKGDLHLSVPEKV